MSEILERPVQIRPNKERQRTVVMDDTQKLTALYSALPDHKKAEALALLEEFAQKAQHQPPPLLEVCPREKSYDVWKVANSSKDGKHCLKENWGPWLKAFNPDLDRDYMSQADLMRLDRSLMKRLRQTYTPNELEKIILPYPMYLNEKFRGKLTKEKTQEALEIRSFLESRRETFEIA